MDDYLFFIEEDITRYNRCRSRSRSRKKKKGPRGATGPTGLRGVAGLRGYIGMTGLSGARGQQGATGLIQGQTGLQGNTGFQGQTGISDLGATGYHGATGLQGNQGATGGSLEFGTAPDFGVLFVTESGGVGIDQNFVFDPNANGGLGELLLAGKLTVSGLIDPTALVLTPTTSGVSGGGATGALWLNATSGNALYFGQYPVQGQPGPTGARGATGLTGNIGASGLTGNTGIQGKIGVTGLNGFSGNTGAQGQQGQTGFQGSTGAMGALGSTGLQGVTGTQGATGFRANTGLQGNTGFQASTGLQGNTGPIGPTGATGDTGVQGVNGATGLIGDIGVFIALERQQLSGGQSETTDLIFDTSGYQTRIGPNDVQLNVNDVQISNGDADVNISSHDPTFLDAIMATGTTGVNTLGITQNGFNWVGQGQIAGMTQVSSLTSNGYISIAMGSGTNTLAYSFDGTLWNGLGTSLFSTAGYAVAWNGEMFTAGGSGGNTLAYSRCGRIWSSATGGLFTSVYGLAWSGREWVAVGSGANYYAISTDGITWTGCGTAVFTSGGRCVKYHPSGYFLAGGVGATNISISTDGITWTSANSVMTTDVLGLDFRMDTTNPMWVAVGAGTNTMAYSENGTTWTGLGTSLFSTSGHAVSWLGSKWLALGIGTNTLAWSRNGLTWMGLGTTLCPVAQSAGLPAMINTVTHATAQCNTKPSPALIVGVGSGTNSIASSSDQGLTWTGFGTSLLTIGYAVAYNGRRWVVGGSGTHGIAWSDQAVTWTGLNLGVTVLSLFWSEVSQAFYAGGTNLLMRSYDGIIWVTLTSPFSANLYNFIDTINGELIAVGDAEAGACSAISNDFGVTWTLNPVDVSTEVYQIATTSSQLICAGDQGLYRSINGSDWSKVNALKFIVGIYANPNDNKVVSIDKLFIRTYNDGLTVNFDKVAPFPVTILHGTLIQTLSGYLMGCQPASATTNIAWSTNLSDWTQIGSSPFSTDCNGLASSHRTQSTKIQQPTVAVGTNTQNTIMFSSSGFDWVGLGSTALTTAGYTALWTGSVWWAGGSGTYPIAYSLNGTKWTPTSIISGYGTMTTVYGLGWTGNRLLVAGIGTGGQAGTLHYANLPATQLSGLNTLTWTPATGMGLSTECRGMTTSGNGVWILTGSGGGFTVSRSTDYGSTWTNYATSLSTGLCVIWTGLRFLVGGDGLIRSTTGISWTSTPSPLTTVYGLAMSHYGIIVMVGQGTDTAAYSTDGGLSWTGLGTSLFAVSGYAVTWNSRMFIATGASGVVQVSDDGINWAPVTGYLTNGLGVASNAEFGATQILSRFDAGSEHIITSQVNTQNDAVIKAQLI
jgi:collagen type VII alpha